MSDYRRGPVHRYFAKGTNLATLNTVSFKQESKIGRYRGFKITLEAKSSLSEVDAEYFGSEIVKRMNDLPLLGQPDGHDAKHDGSGCMELFLRCTERQMFTLELLRIEQARLGSIPKEGAPWANVEVCAQPGPSLQRLVSLLEFGAACGRDLGAKTSPVELNSTGIQSGLLWMKLPARP
jgi:hypothetical protein